jgi:hypothetical protein
LFPLFAQTHHQEQRPKSCGTWDKQELESNSGVRHKRVDPLRAKECKPNGKHPAKPEVKAKDKESGQHQVKPACSSGFPH